MDEGHRTSIANDTEEYRTGKTVAMADRAARDSSRKCLLDLRTLPTPPSTPPCSKHIVQLPEPALCGQAGGRVCGRPQTTALVSRCRCGRICMYPLPLPIRDSLNRFFFFLIFPFFRWHFTVKSRFLYHSLIDQWINKLLQHLHHRWL